MESYDVVVVGAGPAGAMTAYLASSMGLKVLLVDKAKHPRERPCGGGLTPRTVKLLARHGLDPEDVILNRCVKIVGKAAGGIRVELIDEPISLTKRSAFDDWLLKKAVGAGADFALDHVVYVEGDEVVGLRSSYRGRAVVGADGVLSVVAKSIGMFKLKLGDTHGVACTSLVEIDLDGNTCYFDYAYPRERRAKGFAWVFPLSNRTANVGLGVNWTRELHVVPLLEDYVRELGGRIGRIVCSPITVGSVRGVGRDNVILVGEAGGFVDGMTGEGIYYALLTASIASAALHVSLRTYGDPMRLAKVYGDMVKEVVEEVRWTRRIAHIAATAYYVSPAVFRGLIGRVLNIVMSAYRSGSYRHGLIL